jgi:hypothetical protein
MSDTRINGIIRTLESGKAAFAAFSKWSTTRTTCLHSATRCNTC